MEAIVLTRRDFREVDQIVSLYTKDKGKIEVLARGVKKITSKNTAHLEPFSHVFIDVVKGKEIDHLIKVIPVDTFAGLRQDLKRRLGAEYVVGFLNQMYEVGLVDSRVWEILTSWLYFANRTQSFRTIIVDAFVLQIFNVLGLAPILDKCVVSGATYKEMLKGAFVSGHRPLPGFYFAGGGLVSPVIKEEKIKVGEKVVRCSLKEISNMQSLLRSNWQVVSDLDLPVAEYKVLHNIIFEFVLYHSNKKVGDWYKLIKIAE